MVATLKESKTCITIIIVVVGIEVFIVSLIIIIGGLVKGMIIDKIITITNNMNPGHPVHRRLATPTKAILKAFARRCASISTARSEVR